MTFKFPQCSFFLVWKIQWKETFRHHGLRKGRGYITKKRTILRFFFFCFFFFLFFFFFHVGVVAYRDGKLCRANLDKAYILNGFSNRKTSSASVRKHVLQVLYRISVESNNVAKKNQRRRWNVVEETCWRLKKGDNRDRLSTKHLVSRASRIIYTRGYLYQV